jgi:glutamate--cysteine ligase
MNWESLLKKSKHALERECLRVTEKGELAKDRHPKAFGDPLKNPEITLDFAEAQLEFVSPSFYSKTDARDSLRAIHDFTDEHLKDDLLWPFSMPCRLPKNDNDIRVAEFGKSPEGKKKHLYRQGLKHRYNARMQTISGIHYNFSLDDSFFKAYKKHFKLKDSLKDLRSKLYFHIMRNFLRLNCLNIYFFGAAPIFDKTYVKKKHSFLKKWDKDSYYGKFATSFRTSELGYISKVQSQIFMSHDGLDDYLKDLKYAISTPKEEYKNIEQQMNDNILQIEAEYYSVIRPKQPPRKNETAIQALKQRGVKYLEVRALDLNPFTKTGINEAQLCFLETLLIYSLFTTSPKISEKEYFEILDNQNAVSLHGRNPKLKVTKNSKKILFQTWAQKEMNKIKKIANLLDKNYKDCRCKKSFYQQFEKIKNPNLTQSGQILQNMRQNKKSFLDYGLQIAKMHQKNLSQMYLEGYEELEGSTQLVIREALKRGVKVDVLDQKANFIRLQKGRHIEYVKQGNKTAKDSYMTFLIMENKHVSKILLKEKGVRVPAGELYFSEKDALTNYSKFKNKKVVVKPTDTNFGIGISFAKTRASYAKAVKEAFHHSSSVIVEEFIEGKEYRFLVTGNKVSGIVHREPANVVGDGKSSIEELIDQKNTDPAMVKVMTGYIIHKTKFEKDFLKAQNLTFSSRPKKGRKIYLRETSNLHTGGDAIDYTDLIPDRFKRVAIKAAKAVDAKVCGVDMLIKGQSYAIIEINFNPAMQMHNFPTIGKNRHVERDLLDLLGF